MDEKSTQVKSDRKGGTKVEDTVGVSSKTLNFLKMFARAYQAETSLTVTQGVACVN